MTPTNRQRLVVALLERVEVNETAGTINLRLAPELEAAA
jgi:hypothetical protein